MKTIMIKKSFVVLLSVTFIAQIYFGNIVSYAEITPSQEQDITIGDGTAANPYQIWNVSQLQKITIKGLSKNYILMSDIIFDSQDSWNPVGSSASPFKGTLDGNGFVIKNMSINSDIDNAGLFGYINAATIKNLSLEKVNIQGKNSVGSIVGYAYGAACIIENCKSTGTVKGNDNVGGLVGKLEYGMIKKCFMDGTVNGTSRVGGLAGYIVEGHILQCYNKSNVTATNYSIGGLAGELAGSVIASNYTTATIKESFNLGVVQGWRQVGGIVGMTTSKGSISDCYNRGEIKSGSENCGGITGYLYQSTVNRCYSTGDISGTGLGGIAGSVISSSLTNCVAMCHNINANAGAGRINNSSEASSFSNNAAYEDMVVKSGYIKQEIKSTNPAHNSKNGMNISEEKFTGDSTFLENLSWNFSTVWMMPDTKENFPVLKSINSEVQKAVYPLGTKKNPYLINNEEDFKKIPKLGMDRYYKLMADVEIMSENWTPIGTASAPFKGELDGNHFKIKKLKISESADYKGLFGYIYGADIKNLELVNCSIQGKDYVGSIAGYAYGTCIIENCSSTGTVKGNDYVGGLVGKLEYGMIKKCFMDGTVNGTSRVGGLTGYIVQGHILQSYNKSNVTATNYSIGGLAGELSGSVIASNYTTATIKESFNLGVVQGWRQVGGIVGTTTSKGSISDCYNREEIKTGGENCGGIAGYIYESTVNRCYSSGDISGGSTLGGIAGSISSGNITNCVAMCHNINGSAGAGRISNSFEQSYSNNAAYEDMIVKEGSTILNIKPTNPAHNSKNGMNISEEKFTADSTFLESLSWDFEKVWRMPNESSEYPILRNFQSVPQVDTSALEALVNDAKAIENDGFTVESWEILQEAILSAELILANQDKTQEQVNDEYISLKAAINQLVEEENGNKTVIYNNDDQELIYTGKWINSDASDYFNRNAKFNEDEKEASVTLNFTSTSIHVIGTKQDNLGEFDVYIDGEYETTINVKSDERKRNRVLFSKDGLSAGIAHTIEIKVKEGNYVIIEAFIAGTLNTNVVTKGTYNNNNSALVYTGEWVDSNAPDYNNGNAKYNQDEKEASVKLSFTGTSISFIGTKQDNLGEFDVYIDGKYETTVDAKSDECLRNQVLFLKEGLSTGKSHTIEIKVKDGNYVIVEAFIVG